VIWRTESEEQLMKTISKFAIAACALALGSGTAFAGEFTAVKTPGKGSVMLDIGFSGDEKTTDAQADYLFDAAAYDVQVQALGGASCTNPKEGMVRVITPDKGAILSKKLTALCRVTFVEKAGGKGSGAVKVDNIVCGDGIGNETGCGSTEADLSIR
jgi:hypothetical protein